MCTFCTSIQDETSYIAKDTLTFIKFLTYAVPHYLCQSSWTLNSFQGTLQTSGYPLKMPPRMRCMWTIIVQPGYTLKLDFKSIDLDKRDPVTGSCRFDYLVAISNKGDVQILCGSRSDHVLQFQDPGKVHLLLRTDAVRQGKGFQLQFKQINQQ